MAKKASIVDLIAREIREHGQLVWFTSDDGKHFTEVYSEEIIDELEKGGWIRVYRGKPGNPNPKEWWYALPTQQLKNLIKEIYADLEKEIFAE